MLCGLFNEEICGATAALQVFEDCISKSVRECLFDCLMGEIRQGSHESVSDVLEKVQLVNGGEKVATHMVSKHN